MAPIKPVLDLLEKFCLMWFPPSNSIHREFRASNSIGMGVGGHMCTPVQLSLSLDSFALFLNGRFVILGWYTCIFTGLTIAVELQMPLQLPNPQEIHAKVRTAVSYCLLLGPFSSDLVFFISAQSAGDGGFRRGRARVSEWDATLTGFLFHSQKQFDQNKEM